MGAGHCQWGGLTDQNICNIHGGAHLASNPILMPKMKPVGPRAAAGGSVTDGRKARKYIMIMNRAHQRLVI